MPSSTSMITQQVKGRVYNYEYSMGGTSGDRGFFAPVDFAVGPEGRLYVINSGFEFYSQYAGLTACTLDHEILWSDRGLTFGAGRESAFPKSVALDAEEKVYVSDDYNNQIYILSKDGDYLDSWGSRDTGKGATNDFSGRAFNLYLRKVSGQISPEGELNGPAGLAFDQDYNLYVVDAHNHRVQKFTKDGQFLSGWGSYGSGEGQFSTPWGIAIDNEGDIYVADWRNHRVQKLSPDGKYLATFGGPGSGEGELNYPASVAVDSDGDVYVADWGSNLLKIFDREGAFITHFVGDASEPSQWALDRINVDPTIQRKRQLVDLTPTWRFWRPIAVNVDYEGRIMVLEALHHRLQIYRKEKDWLLPDYIDGQVGPGS